VIAQGLTMINFPQSFLLFLLVEMKEDFLGSYPLLDFKGNPNAVDELVCFQEAQTLPLFLIMPKRKEMATPTPAPRVNHASPARDPSPHISPRHAFPAGNLPRKLSWGRIFSYLLGVLVVLFATRALVMRKKRLMKLTR